MILDLAIVLTWLAAGYRTWVLMTQPRTIWRTSFTVSMAATAVAFTLYRFRLPLDQLTGSMEPDRPARPRGLLGWGGLPTHLPRCAADAARADVEDQDLPDHGLRSGAHHGCILDARACPRPAPG